MTTAVLRSGNCRAIFGGRTRTMRRRCITTRSEVAEVVWTPANDQIAKSNVAAVANRKSPGEGPLVFGVGELKAGFSMAPKAVSQSREDSPSDAYARTASIVAGIVFSSC